MTWLIGGVVAVAIACLAYVVYGPAWLDRRDAEKRARMREVYRNRWLDIEDSGRRQRFRNARSQQEDSAGGK